MNSIQFYTEALDAVAKGKWLQNTQTYESIVWKDPNDTVSKEIIDAKVAELQAAYDSKQYQRDRSTSYPSIQEQLDMQYWDRKNGTNKWEEFIDKVKADNPKPSE